MGEDKAFLNVGDPPGFLWQRQLELLGSISPDQLLLSHNAHQVFEVSEGVETVADLQSDCGPLGGLVSCLRKAEHDHLLVLAVDLPQMTSGFLSELLATGSGVVLIDQANKRYEAVVAVYTRECLEIAERRLAKGALAMQKFIAECVEFGFLEVKPVREADRELLKNWNRPGDIISS
ncbi:MAG: molybdopterin-guanine dinucleotide biosynthesis protein A [Verrucomicrobiales bacterium]|jgi:molybdopterin-guanine dinucleotide biosynthesis protein A